ncbi:hypothetical protein ACVWXQ_004412 [Bradyrhizobium sp. S3.14.4]
MAQAKLDSSGMKARPCRPAPPMMRSIRNAGARHVAEVFQQQDEQEDDDDLRQEHDDAADARYHAVLKEALQQAGGQGGVHEFAERVEAVVEQVHQRLCPGEHRLEHHEQDESEHDQAADRMQHDRIDPRGPGVGSSRQADAVGDDAVGLALGGAQLGDAERAPAVLPRLRGEFRRDLVRQRQQVGRAALAHRDRGDHGHAELLGEPLHVDGDAAAARDVEHVEHEDHRPAGALQLQQQADGQAQIGRVGHAQHEVGHGFAGRLAEHEVTSDLLVRAAAAQRVGAGQVDHRDLASQGRDEEAFLALDGDAGIVRDLLSAAGQRVEQRRLAAVRRAHQGEMQQRSFHGIRFPVAI